MNDSPASSIRSRLAAAAALLLPLALASTAHAQTDAPAEPPPPPAAPADSPPPAPPPVTIPVVVPVEETPVVQTTPQPPSWTRVLTVGGGAILWYYQPFTEGAKNDISIFFANVLLDARHGNFGFHVEPRFRNGKVRPFFDGPAWVQEAYADGTFRSDDAALVVKAGKVYSQFGLFWDNSFYGNVQVYDGLKLDPDYGLSLEGTLAEKGRFGARAWAQFFLVDGGTNVSLQGRDTISIAGAHRRDQLIGRLEPFARIGDHGLAKLGLSAESLQADLPGLGKKNVFRGAADLTYAWRALTLWAEYTRQNGQTVTDFPVAGTAATATAPAVPGQAAKHVNYALAGGEYTYGLVTGRYVFSWGDYHDVHVTETMHVPSLGVALNPGLSLLAELVVWQRHAATTSFVDRSLNVTLNGHF